MGKATRCRLGRCTNPKALHWTDACNPLKLDGIEPERGTSKLENEMSRSRRQEGIIKTLFVVQALHVRTGNARESRAATSRDRKGFRDSGFRALGAPKTLCCSYLLFVLPHHLQAEPSRPGISGICCRSVRIIFYLFLLWSLALKQPHAIKK